jgi:hypothetical protein
LWARWGIVGLSGIGIVAACTTDNAITQSGTIIGPGTTSVSVDPDNFLGAAIDADAGARSPVHPIKCSNKPGTMQSYVATVSDVTNPFLLPSSPPTICSQSVYFEYVITGDAFIGEVDGYEQAPADLAPACSFEGTLGACTSDAQCPTIYGCGGVCIVSFTDTANPESLRGEDCSTAPDGGAVGAVSCVCSYTSANGDRQMYYPLSYATAALRNTPVTPRWTTSSETPCGETYPNGLPCTQPCTPGPGCNPCEPGLLCQSGYCAPQSQPYANVSVAPCAALVDNGGSVSSITTIEVIPAAALGNLSCAQAGVDGGANAIVTAFDVVPTDPTLAPVLGIPCSSSEATGGVAFIQGLVPDRSYVFTLDAYQAGQTAPTQSSQCFAPAHEGVTTTAMCDPLAPVP